MMSVLCLAAVTCSWRFCFWKCQARLLVLGCFFESCMNLHKQCRLFCNKLLKYLRTSHERGKQYHDWGETQIPPDGTQPSGRPIHGWEDTMKMDLTETGCRGCWQNVSYLGKFHAKYNLYLTDKSFSFDVPVPNVIKINLTIMEITHKDWHMARISPLPTHFMQRTYNAGSYQYKGCHIQPSSFANDIFLYLYYIYFFRFLFYKNMVVIYVFLLEETMYCYCYLCILIVSLCYSCLCVVYVLLLLSMYTYF